ncbi:hypothetical protein KIPB_015826, partial [Kipferlia bialata]|eukprot:g15826.t1
MFSICYASYIGKGWHLLFPVKKHDAHMEDCDALAVVGLQTLYYPVDIDGR